MAPTVEHLLAADHPSAAGHFPGNPVIPGVVLLQAVISAIGGAYPGLVCREVAAAKFLHPVRPGETLSIEWDDGPGRDIRFSARVGGTPVVTGALRLGSP